MRKQSERFDMLLDPELREAAEKIATAKERSLAWVIRDALRRYIEQESQPD